MSAFEDVSLARLRERRSAKWTVFGPDVLPMWVAELDFPLAPPVKAALRDAVERDDCGYANAGGLMEAFADFAQRRFGWTVDPARVYLVPDVMVGVAEVLRAVTAPGDGVAVNSPVYQPFFQIVREVERRIVNVPLLATPSGYELDFAALERAFAGGVRAYLLCSPHNPVGRVWTRGELVRIAQLAAQYRVIVIADEIHGPLTLPDAVHLPFAAIAEPLGAESIVITAASKAWNIAGLKCALLVAGSEAMQTQAKRLPVELRYRAGHLGVLASIAAFRDGEPWLDALLAQLDRNRALLATLLAETIPAIGYHPPQFGYLAWLDCAALAIAGDPVAYFLKRGRVAIVRGTDFGAGGEGFIRVNVGTSPELVAEGVARLRAALDAGG